MAELVASGRIVDIVVGFMALEAALLYGLNRRTDRGLDPAGIVGILLPGLVLLLALRAALTGAAWPWIAGLLLASLVAHVGDLRRRWR